MALLCDATDEHRVVMAFPVVVIYQKESDDITICGKGNYKSLILWLKSLYRFYNKKLLPYQRILFWSFWFWFSYLMSKKEFRSKLVNKVNDKSSFLKICGMYYSKTWTKFATLLKSWCHLNPILPLLTTCYRSIV